MMLVVVRPRSPALISFDFGLTTVSSCDARDVGAWAKQTGFNVVNVTTVAKQITFPSMLNYVQFQLTATPMAALLKERDEPERERLILTIADEAASQLDPSMLVGGKLTFPQESFVASASLL